MGSGGKLKSGIIFLKQGAGNVGVYFAIIL